MTSLSLFPSNKPSLLFHLIASQQPNQPPLLFSNQPLPLSHSLLPSTNHTPFIFRLVSVIDTSSGEGEGLFGAFARLSLADFAGAVPVV